MPDTVCGAEPVAFVASGLTQTNMAQEEKSRQKKKGNKQQRQQPQQKKQKPPPEVKKPFYETLGEELLRSTRLHLEPITQPLPKTTITPAEVSVLPPSMLDSFDYLSPSKPKRYHPLPPSTSATSLALPRRSTESDFSGITKVSHDEENPAVENRCQGAVYNLQDFVAVSTIEDLILRYGRVAHMGVRDHSYKFWMNTTRTAVVHFKVLDKVAVLGGDPLCHPDRIALTLKEFELYCKKVGWRTAVIGGSINMANLAKQKGWTCMNFGMERVLNPQTNEVLLGKSGKRIITQCKQLLDSSRGGISVHTYCPSQGRNKILESTFCNIYDSWRNERNSSRNPQAFVTVFDLFAMHNLMTFLYTTDKLGQVNGFAALRKCGATSGYHIDPFIQTSNAPRGISDLLIFASLAFLNAQGCSHLSLGYEPVTELSEIWGLPTIFHSTTKKVYKYVFGKIPVGGKEAFHARWKPDEKQEAPMYLVFIGKIPSPRYMLAMMHFTNISLRQIIASDWQAFVASKEKKGGIVVAEEDGLDGENPGHDQTQVRTQGPRTIALDFKFPNVSVKEIVGIGSATGVKTATS